MAHETWLNDRKHQSMAQLAISALCDAVQAVRECKSVFLDDIESASSRYGKHMLTRACRIAKATGWKDPE